MNNIVKFPIERTNLKETPAQINRADIVIFPGVRIERREFSLADRHAKPSRNLTGNALAKDI